MKELGYTFYAVNLSSNVKALRWMNYLPLAFVIVLPYCRTMVVCMYRCMCVTLTISRVLTVDGQAIVNGLSSSTAVNVAIMQLQVIGCRVLQFGFCSLLYNIFFLSIEAFISTLDVYVFIYRWLCNRGVYAVFQKISCSVNLCGGFTDCKPSANVSMPIRSLVLPQYTTFIS